MGDLKTTFGLSTDLSDDLTNKIKKLEEEKQALLNKTITQQHMIVTFERKLAKFYEIREQRDWLLDEMTKKIGELSHFQSELFKAERLSAIGEMSARLAHDMRNPLAIIKNTIELVKLKYSAKIPNELFHLFTSIDNASSRLVFQLDDVLNFVRSSPLDKNDFSASDILESAIAEIVVPDQIRIHKSTNDVILSCDGEKIQAVFTNLIMNSIQAMDNCGDVMIQFTESDDDVIFMVRDSGPGIKDELIDKIFEPLFTTKSRGTGLGLPAVKTIIQQHQGTIEVSNNPTTFTIKLPKIPSPV